MKLKKAFEDFVAFIEKEDVASWEDYEEYCELKEKVEKNIEG